jgi:two-component system OmpR family response regulator
MERQAKLLLIEDEHGLRGLVALFLRGEGLDVLEAADGLEGVRRYEESGPFDLVLLDLNLPGLPGVEVGRAIRRRQPSQPILICSAAIMPEHEGALRAIGVDRFLTKPFLPETLLAQVHREIVTHTTPTLAPSCGPTPHSYRRGIGPSFASK